jgi:hypothetical protein
VCVGLSNGIPQQTQTFSSGNSGALASFIALAVGLLHIRIINDVVNRDLAASLAPVGPEACPTSSTAN